MKNHKLPNIFNLDSNKDFLVYNYHTKEEISKQLVDLQMHTFCFLIDGKKEVFHNTDPLTITPNSFILIKRGHCLMTEKLTEPNSSYQSLLFFVSDKAIQKFIFRNKTHSKPNTKAIHTFQYDSFLKKFVSGLAEICKLESTLQDKLLANKFEELMIYLTARHQKHFLSSFTNNHAEFTHVIEGNKYQKLSLKELAFLCNMSISTFKREFQKQYHHSPSKWFQEQRLEYAQFLLKNSRPSDIYTQVGYETLSNFTQAFKTKYGITPKQYQEK